MKRFGILVSIVTTATLILGCGADDGLTSGSGGNSGNDPEMVDVSVAVYQSDQTGGSSLSLAALAATSYSVNITACRSGYTATGLTAATIPLYKNDKDCLAGLVEFVYNAKTWVPVDATPLTTGSALFEDELDATSQMNVTVYEALPAVLSTNAPITFVFQEILIGTTHVVANYSSSHAISVDGLEAPNLTISSVSIESFVDAGAAGWVPLYDITFACAGAVSGASDEFCATAVGAVAQDMRQMNVSVIWDNYAGVLTWAQANAAVTADSVPATTLNTTGFVAQDVQQDLGPLYTKKNLLIIVEYVDPDLTGMKSYRYFNADIGEPTL